MLYITFIIFAVLMQAFFTASEMAFTTVNKIKLKHLASSGNKYALKVDNLLKEEGSYLGATLVGTNLAVIVSSVLATRIFAEYFDWKIAPVMATAVMVPLTLIFAEITPKMIARQFSTTWALKTVKPLGVFLKVFYPIIIVVNSIARFFLMPFGKRVSAWNLTFTKNDLKKMLLLGYETGEVEADEVELIHKVLDLGTKEVDMVMVPFSRVSSINVDDNVQNLKSLVSLTGFSRVPAYENDKNNIIGIINIYDILFSTEIVTKKSLKDFVREPVYVGAKDGLDIALTRLRHKKQPMGIVVDKKRRAVGVITIEDILEEIVGELEDEE
ncbi:MAG: CNNM domain-containing protein [Candidatus Omnitrophota bacterium]